MSDNVIREQVVIDGDQRGAHEALNATKKDMGAVEQKAAQVASKLQTFGARVSGFFSRVGDFAARAGKVALWGGIISGAALATLGIVTLTRNVLRLAAASDQVREFNRSWNQVKATLASPFVHFAAQAFSILNAALRDPAVQYMIRQLALLAALILRSVLPAVSALAGAITAFAHALMEGDWANIFQRTWTGFVEGWKAAGKAAGASAGASFNEAWAEEAAKAAKADTSGPLRGGFLKDIGDLGTNAINALLSGFKKADLNVLNQAAEAIRTRLDTLFKQGKVAEITIVPRMIGAESVVADALREANAAGGVNEQILARVRERLAGLGPDVVEYVVQLLRARDATLQVEQATSDLADKQAALAAAQKDVADAQARQAAEAAKFLPISDEIRDLQQELAQKLIDQTADRERLVELAEEEEDAQRELAKLQAEQEQRLAALAPLRQAIADAAEEQYQAELKVRAAQEALVPLQEKLKSAQADAAKLQAEITENQRLRNEAIEDAQSAFNKQVADLQKAIDHVGDKYKEQLDDQQKILDAADARWKTEIDGATETFNITKKRFDLEDARNNKALLNFAQQRAAANLISDPNKRIAALARINRAEDQYQSRNKDRLEAARLANELAEQELKTKEAARDADKADALVEIERIQGLIESDRKLLQERLATVREEGQARIDALREAAKEAERREAADLRAAAATVAAAQADVDRQQGAIDLLEKDVQAARDKQTNAERELASREKTIHAETDGAIAVAKTRADSAATEREALDDRLGDETRTLEQNIARKQADYDLQKSKADEVAEKELRPLQARLDTAQAEVDAAEIVLDNSQTTLDNYSNAAQLASDRLTTEQQITNLVDQQRQLLDDIARQQAASNPAAGGPGFGGADLAKQLAKPFSDEEIDAFAEKLKTLFTRAFDKLKDLNLDGFWQSILDKGVKFLQDHPEAMIAMGVALSKGLGGGASLGFFLGKLLLQDPGQALLMIGQSPFTLIGGAIGFAIGGPAGAAFFAGFGQALDQKWQEWLTGWAKEDVSQNIGKGIVRSLDLPGAFEAERDLLQKVIADEEANRKLYDALKSPFQHLWDALFGHSIFPDLRVKIGEFYKDLPGIIEPNAKNVLTSLITPFSDAAIKIGGPSAGFIKNILDGVTGGGNSLQTNALPIYKTFADGISGLAKGTRDLVVGESKTGGYFNDIKTGVHNSLAATKADSVGETGQGGIVGSLTAGITGLFAGAKAIVSDPVTGTLAKMGADAKARASEMQTALIGAGAPIPTTKEGMVRAFTEANSTITDASTGPLSTMGSGLAAILRNVGVALFGAEGTGGAIAALGQGVRAAFDLIFGPETQENTILNLLNKGKKPGGSSDGGFFPRLEWMVNSELDYQRIETWKASFIEIRDTLIKFLNGEDDTGGFINPILSKLTDLGKKIAQAIAAGMRAQLTDIYNAGKELVNSAYKGADDAAGNPQSPAPRFIPLGESSGEGYGEGLLRMTARVQNIAAGLVDAGVKAMQIRSSMLGGIGIPEAGFNPALALAQMGGLLPGIERPDTRNYFVGTISQNFGTPSIDPQNAEWMDMFTR